MRTARRMCRRGAAGRRALAALNQAHDWGVHQKQLEAVRVAVWLLIAMR